MFGDGRCRPAVCTRFGPRAPQNTATSPMHAAKTQPKLGRHIIHCSPTSSSLNRAEQVGASSCAIYACCDPWASFDTRTCKSPGRHAKCRPAPHTSISRCITREKPRSTAPCAVICPCSGPVTQLPARVSGCSLTFDSAAVELLYTRSKILRAQLCWLPVPRSFLRHGGWLLPPSPFCRGQLLGQPAAGVLAG